MRVRAHLAILLAVAACGASAEPHTRIRGITLSTHRSNGAWDSDTLGATFADLRSLGSNWVAIHPYAGISRDGTVRFAPLDPEHPPRWLVRPIEEAHRHGLQILIKPHLAHWRSGFSWRGEIAFQDEASWARFFETYGEWIATLARASRGADAFAVGTELDRTVHREREWRDLIARVRAATDAPLTYASNWSEYDRVPFWKALDAIGVQAYFPLAATPGADPAELRRGWREGMRRLRQVADRLDKDVVFTELGYPHTFDAAVRPWTFGSDGPAAAPVAEACLRAALEAIEEEPRVIGAFLWKWFPQPRTRGRDFELDTPGMRRVIREAWAPADR
jgi:Glycoside Hydrolase Family 113